MVYASIVGFTGDPQNPLILSNGASLNCRKRVCKLTTVPASDNPLGYDPQSGHFHALADFVLGNAAPQSPPSAVHRTGSPRHATSAPATAFKRAPQSSAQGNTGSNKKPTKTMADCDTEATKNATSPRTAMGEEKTPKRSSARKTRQDETSHGEQLVVDAAGSPDTTAVAQPEQPPSAMSGASATTAYSWLSDAPLVPTMKASSGKAGKTATAENTTPGKSGGRSAAASSTKGKRKMGDVDAGTDTGKDGKGASADVLGADTREEGSGRKSPRARQRI
jgi:hypothetical protein